MTTDDGDRDDADASVYPGAEERCDGVDNDCNGLIDDDPIDTVTWYLDYDGDGFGDADWSLTGCEPADGYVADGSDCDDLNAAVYPGAEEVCDGADNDCDTEVDEGLLVSGHIDADGDGYGADESMIDACGTLEGVAMTGGDRDDTDPSIHPAASLRSATLWTMTAMASSTVTPWTRRPGTWTMMAMALVTEIGR